MARRFEVSSPAGAADPQAVSLPCCLAEASRGPSGALGRAIGVPTQPTQPQPHIAGARAHWTVKQLFKLKLF
eukprot:scaffold203622_cov33-Tisochrysis_lutea.AAC.1